MILRKLINCATCSEFATLRMMFPLGGNGDSYLFPCPSCNSPLHGTYVLGEPPSMEINSTDFTISEQVALPTDTYPIVTVSTDMPVHRTRHVASLTDGGSPFLWMVKQMPAEFPKYRSLVESLDHVRSTLWPHFKKAVGFADIREWTKAAMVLGPLIPGPMLAGKGPIYSFYRVLETTFVPLVRLDTAIEVKDEWFTYLNDCLSSKQSEYEALLRSFICDLGFNAYREKVFNVYSRLIDHFESVMIGVLYEESPATFKATISEYRTFRNDYDVVKALYVDIFELVARSTVYISSVVNLSVRHDPQTYLPIDQRGRLTTITSHTAFKRLAAFDKLKVFAELPKLEALVGQVSRPMRNDIGHFNAHYDFRSGDLAYEDGRRSSYIEFLGYLVAAVRAMWLLLSINEKLDIDMDQLRLAPPAGTPC